MDLTIFQFLYGLTGSSFFDIVVVFIGKHLPFILALGAIIFVIKQKGWKMKITTFCFIGLNIILAKGILGESFKEIIGRVRPFELLGIDPLFAATDFAFPSGHASLLFALALAIYYFNNRWGIWYIVLASLNMVARVTAGVHWPSDILAGVLVAFVSFGIVYLLTKNYLPVTED